MRLLTMSPSLIRGAFAVMVFMIVIGLLFGPTGLRHEPQSAEAALFNEFKKLLASDAEAGDRFGISAAVSADTAVVGAYVEDGGATAPVPPTCFSVTRAAQTIGAR